jgi:two-component system phosphate regulon sensor histidine kinase PhoR
VKLDGFPALALAFAAAALLGAWNPWAGLALGLACSAWFWKRLSVRLGPLQDFIAKLESGDFGARLPVGSRGIQEALRPGLEAMASGLGERFLAAEELRRQLMAALNGMSEGVALCDAQGAILLINPSFRRLAGFEEAGQRRYFLWEAVRDPHLTEAVEAALKQSRSSTVDLPLDQGRLEGRALVAPVEGGPGGGGAGAVVFLFDRTEERKLERLRSEFVANVSHELRTPLSAIKAALETLRDGALDDSSVNQAFLQKAIHHSERLEELLNDLLTLSQIEEQRRRGLSRHDAVCSPSDAWAEAESLLETVLRRYHGTVSAQLPADLPDVGMELGALRQIILNYIENALKYSGPEPKVEVGARRDGAHVEVWVRDQGQGIPEADLPRVFERFFRVEKARTRVGGGSGLGLSIVKHLAENAGAQVGVESQVGRGSRFWVRLRVAQP